MTSAVEPAPERADARTIVGGGAVLGTLTAAGVVAFALLSRALSGDGEVIVQSVIVLAGGLVASFFPAHLVQPRHVDGIAWASLLGLVGTLCFTVIDTMLLRPLAIYHWTWDAIGGGSGFWYVPVWWMGGAAVAWLGAWIVAIRARGGPGGSVIPPAAMTGVVAALLFVLLVVVRTPLHAAVMALGLALALPLHVALAAIVSRR